MGYPVFVYVMQDVPDVFIITHILIFYSVDVYVMVRYKLEEIMRKVYV